MDDISTEIQVGDMHAAREKLELSVSAAQAANRLMRVIGLARGYPHRFREAVDRPPPCVDEAPPPMGPTSNPGDEPSKKAARTEPPPGLPGVAPELRKYMLNFEPTPRFMGFVKTWKVGPGSARNITKSKTSRR